MRKQERDIETLMHQHWLAASFTVLLGIKPTNCACAMMGNWTSIILVHVSLFNHWTTPVNLFSFFYFLVFLFGCTSFLLGYRLIHNPTFTSYITFPYYLILSHCFKCYLYSDNLETVNLAFYWTPNSCT